LSGDDVAMLRKLTEWSTDDGVWAENCCERVKKPVLDTAVQAVNQALQDGNDKAIDYLLEPRDNPNVDVVRNTVNLGVPVTTEMLCRVVERKAARSLTERFTSVFDFVPIITNGTDAKYREAQAKAKKIKTTGRRGDGWLFDFLKSRGQTVEPRFGESDKKCQESWKLMKTDPVAHTNGMHGMTVAKTCVQETLEMEGVKFTSRYASRRLITGMTFRMAQVFGEAVGDMGNLRVDRITDMF
jgi:hypothetical protein